MNTTRELLRAEMKSTAYHRRMVKARARNLFREAQVYAETPFKEGGYKRWYGMVDAATSLRGSRASYARSLNIASGLIRGIPYRKIEAKCNEAPNAEEILEIIQSHASWREKREWTLERVKGLLE